MHTEPRAARLLKTTRSSRPGDRCLSCLSCLTLKISMNSTPKKIAATIIAGFSPLPVPSYPPMMGMDPLGVDEYAGFANVPWSKIPPKPYGNNGYDISPPVGFSSAINPHMWNYHLPGFMMASLLHETEHEPTDSFMWTMRRIIPKTDSIRDPSLPWWAGNDFNSNYSVEQCHIVVRYLEFLRDHGLNAPYYYDWTHEDDKTLARWTDS